MTMHSKSEIAKRQAFITPEAQKQQHAIHAKVGLYIIAWSSVESLLVGLVGHLLGTSKANAQILYTGLSTVQKRRTTIEALIRNGVQDPLRTRMLSALNVFKSVTKVRNDLAHGGFEFNEQGGYIKIWSYNLDDAELENAAATSRPIDRHWLAEIEDGMRRISFLDHELGEITDA